MVRREEEASPEIREGCGSWWEVPNGKVQAESALLYLHGFTGCPGDLGDAMQRIRGNAPVAIGAKRLRGHGLSAPDALKGVSKRDWESDGESALEYAASLGRRVWVLGTSLGGTLALLLAARFPDVVSGVVAWSPAVMPRDRQHLNALAAMPEDVLVDRRDRSEGHAKYWAPHVHTDGYRALRSAMEGWCPEIMARGLSCPALFGLGEKDEVADLKAMENLAASIPSTATLNVRRFADGAHALASPFRSAAANEVIEATRVFVLGDRAATGR